jgi:hypothetical protein
MVSINKKYLALSFAIGALAYQSSAFSAPVVRSSGGESSTQRDLTSDDIDQVKKILYEESLKPYSVNPYGLLQANINFVDTARNNTPDFSVTHARFGVLAIEKNWSGKLELEFLGNQPKILLNALTDNVPLYLSQSGNNTVVVRQAQINYDFLRITKEPKLKKASDADKQADVLVQTKKTGQETTATATTDEPQAPKDTYITRLSLGGIRVGGAAATAPDPANTPSGYSRQDGIYLVENMIFNKQALASIGLGVFNNLVTFNSGPLNNFQGWGSYPTTSQNFMGIVGVSSPTFQKAYLLSLGYTQNFSDTKSLNGSVYYGFQKHAAVNTNENGFATTVRNATHAEASLLYNDSKIFGEKAILTGNGLTFYVEVENGSDQSYTSAVRDFEKIKVTLDDGYTNVLYGLSLGGDSSAFLKDIFRNSDRFLYSGSITYITSNFKHSSYSPNYNVTQFAGGVGYGYKTLEIFLNAAYSMSAKPAFTVYKISDRPEVTSTAKSRFLAYITAALYF